MVAEQRQIVNMRLEYGGFLSFPKKKTVDLS